MFLAQNHPLCQGKAKPSLSQGGLGAVAAAAAVPPQGCVEGAAASPGGAAEVRHCPVPVRCSGWGSVPGSAAPGPCVTPWLHGRRDRGCTAAVTKVVIKLGADRDEDCSCTCVLCPGMFSGDTGRHPRRNRSAAAPPRTQGHVACQSIHGRHGPTTAPIATWHAHAHLIRHRACEQTCPAQGVA